MMEAILPALWRQADESLAALRVGVASVHEAVYEGAVADAILLGDVAQLEQMVERRVHAAGAGQSHYVEVHAVVAGVAVGRHNLGVLQYAAVLAGAVDLHKVLIYDAPCTDVQVSDFGISHLSVGQTYVLAAGQQL